MITEDFCSFEIAKLLKEKGFNERCFSFYWPDGSLDANSHDKTTELRNSTSSSVIAPTLQMTMKWLREVYYIHISALCPIVDVDADVLGVKYNVVISNLKNNCLSFDTDIEDNEYNTYEEAAEAAIKYCLENLI